jgi:HEAT repeat protein
VSAVAKLLGDKDLSHMARYVLERVSGPEATAALREALPKTSGRVKVGVINSLGILRDQESTKTVAALLEDSDEQVAAAAAAALGSIGTPDTAKALAGFQAGAPEKLRPAVADAQLACAERLLADGKKLDAMKIYQTLAKSDQPKHVKLAATRGLLAAAGKK